jgi:hypothetical protein
MAKHHTIDSAVEVIANQVLEIYIPSESAGVAS